MGLFDIFKRKKANIQTNAAPYYTFIIDDIFKIKRKGVVVVGIVRGAGMNSGDKVRLLSSSGKIRCVKVVGIEVYRQGIVHSIPENSQVGVWLKGVRFKQLRQFDVITNNPSADPSVRLQALLDEQAGNNSDKGQNQDIKNLHPVI